MARIPFRVLGRSRGSGAGQSEKRKRRRYGGFAPACASEFLDESRRLFCGAPIGRSFWSAGYSPALGGERRLKAGEYPALHTLARKQGCSKPGQGRRAGLSTAAHTRTFRRNVPTTFCLRRLASAIQWQHAQAVACRDDESWPGGPARAARRSCRSAAKNMKGRL